MLENNSFLRAEFMSNSIIDATEARVNSSKNSGLHDGNLSSALSWDLLSLCSAFAARNLSRSATTKPSDLPK